MSSKALLVFQGGGAMGAYQCGAYKAIAEYLRRAEVEVAGVAGASIGALNSALIVRHLGDSDGGAGALEAWWREELAMLPELVFPLPTWYHQCWNGLLSMLLLGNPALSVPNYLGWNPWGTAWRSRVALHDTEPMRRLLERHVGTFGPNPGCHPLLLVRAVNATTQVPAIFHSWRDALTARHFMASSSIPLLYPFAEIDGESYWDGDLLSYSPLRDMLQVLGSTPQPDRSIGDYLVIIVDTVCGGGRKPESTLDLLFQVQAAMLVTRADADEAYAGLNNRYLDFLTDCSAAIEGQPLSGLEKRVASESEAALASGLCRLDIVRIRRKETFPFEYVSRDLDYSRARVDLLIEQGEEYARKILDEHVRQSPSIEARFPRKKAPPSAG